MLQNRTPSRNAAPAALASTLLVLAAIFTTVPAEAESIGNGPVLGIGYSGDEDAAERSGNIAIVHLGWRWSFDGADCIDNLLARAHTDFSWAVEPVIGGVFGDSEAFETSVVPFLRLAPLGWENLVPYFEGGVGIAFTSLRNYGLGSILQFSDNVGLGLTFGQQRRWSVGYRFRHLSHAKLFGDRNEGLNAHFLTISFQ